MTLTKQAFIVDLSTFYSNINHHGYGLIKNCDDHDCPHFYGGLDYILRLLLSSGVTHTKSSTFLLFSTETNLPR